VVQQKVEGKEVTVSDEPETGGAQVIDLMEALRASLERKPSAPPKAAPADEGRKPPKHARAVEPATVPAPAARKKSKA